MGEHRIKRVAPKGDGYKQVQQLRSRPRLVASSASIRTAGFVLRKKEPRR